MIRRYLSAWLVGLTLIALSAACQHPATPQPSEPTPPEPSLTILDAVMSRRVDGNYVPTDVTARFSPTDTFYCAVQVADVAPDTPITARWHFGDTIIGETTYTTEDQGTGYVAFELTNQRPWPSGGYRVEIVSDGIVVTSVSFQVVEPPAE
jgi:hypothetical protein